MKKITSAILFFVVAALGLNAQCPNQPNFILIAEDTNQVFNINQGNFNNIPSVMSCTSTAFCVYPYQWHPDTGGATIYQPCIRTRYNPYFTSVRNNVTESFYENGGLIWTLAPTNPLPNRIGGGTPPVSGASLWDY